MALPGRRRGAGSGFGVAETFQTSSAAYGGNSILGKPRSAAGIVGSDPQLARRVESLEQKVNGQDQAHRTMMDQLMKLSQEMKLELKKKDTMLMEEKNARMRSEQILQSVGDRVMDVEDRLKRVEDSARENKNALAQLISHTKNVERAVTMNQQDLLQRKEQQAAKMQEINHKLATMVSNRENLERMCYTMRDEIADLGNKVDNQTLEIKDAQGALRMQNQMFESQAAKMQQGNSDKESGTKMSETQRAALESRIMQLQTNIMDLQSKLNHERKEREVDMQSLTTRISECSSEISETRRKRDADLKELANTTKELAEMSDAEKQRIVVQISAVQTELKRTMDERDLKLKQLTVNRLEELQNELKLESKQRVENEKEARIAIETVGNKTKLYTDECTEVIRQMSAAEMETLRTRVQEVNEFCNDLEIQLAEMRNENEEMMAKMNTSSEGRDKLFEAKLEDLSDRLRLGMGKLQQAIGETSAKNGRVPDIDTTKLQLEDAEGIREKIRVDLNKIEEQLTELRSKQQSQQNIIEQQLRSHQQQGEEASTILGDKLQQKMDSISFSQERMKRQLDDLQDKTQGAPTEIFDMRERMMDIERDFKNSHKDKKVVNERLENLENDVNHIMGRGETSDVSGIPTLNRLLTNIDECNANHTGLSKKFDDFKSEVQERLDEEANKRENEVEKLHKDQIRSEKRTKALKERMKKMAAPSLPSHSPDEVFEDDDEENE